jgi:hypothetical protein
MSAILLLSRDPGLEQELQSVLNLLQEPPLLLCCADLESLRAATQTLDDIRLIAVDFPCFAPPVDLPFPRLCLCSPDVPPPQEEPALSRPLRVVDWQTCWHLLTPSAGSRAAAEEALPPFACALLDEVLHDLNNQLTSLQGNLLCPVEETAADTDRSLERAAFLVALLQSLDPRNPSTPQPTSLSDFFRDLHRMAAHLLEAPVEMPRNSPAAVRVAPAGLACLLLEICFRLRGVGQAWHWDLVSAPPQLLLRMQARPPTPLPPLPARLSEQAARLQGSLILLDDSLCLRLPPVSD